MSAAVERGMVWWVVGGGGVGEAAWGRRWRPVEHGRGCGGVQYLLPVCLTDMERPDLAMTLTIMDGYYLGNTCLTLEMAYLNARLLARPVAPWLTGLVM